MDRVAGNPSSGRAQSRLASLLKRIRNRVRSAAERARDRRLGIETTAPDWTDGWDPTARNVRYEAARYKTLDVLRRHLTLEPSDVVCDLGCGMGRIVCYFATQPLAGVIGVELDELLASRASRNISSARGLRAPAQVICADATRADLSEVSVLIMYNPFNAEVMRAVLANLQNSLAARPRPLRVVYINPVHAAVFADFAFLKATSRLQVPRLGIPSWSPFKFGGDRIAIWEADPRVVGRDGGAKAAEVYVAPSKAAAPGL